MEQTIRLQITKAEMLSDDIRRLELCDPLGGPLPPFTAGAHLRVLTEVAAGDPWRHYSLLNTTVQGKHYEIAVLRQPNGKGGSLHLCDHLQVGDILVSHLPKNDFPLSAEATEHVLIAGGLGITPILAMAEALAAIGRSFECHYCCKSPEKMAFRDRLHFTRGGRARLYFDAGDPKKGIDFSSALGAPDSSRHVYVCGPRGMIDATIATARMLRWRPENVHFELFSTPVAQDGDRPIEVIAKASSLRILVPRDRSILDCLIEAGLDPLFDCKRGECGACVTTVLDGVPEHRDYVLDDEARKLGKSICICVSRAKTEQLVLDI